MKTEQFVKVELDYWYKKKAIEIESIPEKFKIALYLHDSFVQEFDEKILKRNIKNVRLSYTMDEPEAYQENALKIMSCPSIETLEITLSKRSFDDSKRIKDSLCRIQNLREISLSSFQETLYYSLNFLPVFKTLKKLEITKMMIYDDFNQVLSETKLKDLWFRDVEFEEKFTFKCDFSKLKYFYCNSTPKITLKGFAQSLKGNKKLKMLTFDNSKLKQIEMSNFYDILNSVQVETLILNQFLFYFPPNENYKFNIEDLSICDTQLDISTLRRLLDGNLNLKSLKLFDVKFNEYNDEKLDPVSTPNLKKVYFSIEFEYILISLFDLKTIDSLTLSNCSKVNLKQLYISLKGNLNLEEFYILNSRLERDEYNFIFHILNETNVSLFYIENIQSIFKNL